MDVIKCDEIKRNDCVNERRERCIVRGVKGRGRKVRTMWERESKLLL